MSSEGRIAWTAWTAWTGTDQRGPARTGGDEIGKWFCGLLSEAAFVVERGRAFFCFQMGFSAAAESVLVVCPAINRGEAVVRTNPPRPDGLSGSEECAARMGISYQIENFKFRIRFQISKLKSQKSDFLNPILEFKFQQ
jgi:hypothetical protein